MRKPLSISLEKLRRAQRSLIRRKRGSKVRVSFSHQQPVAFVQRQQRSTEKDPAHSRPIRPDPPWIRRPSPEPLDVSQQPGANPPPLRWVEDHRPSQQVGYPRRTLRNHTPYPLRQDDGCCDDSFDETKEHRYWGNMRQPPMSAPSNAKPATRRPFGPYNSQSRPLGQAVGFPAIHTTNGQRLRTSRHPGQPKRTARRPARDKRQEKLSVVRTPVAYYKEREPTPNSKRCGIADPEV